MDEKICTNTIVYILIMCSIFLSSEDRSEGFIMVLILGGVFCFFLFLVFFFLSSCWDTYIPSCVKVDQTRTCHIYKDRA